MIRPLTVWHVSSNRWNSAITEYALSAARALNLAGHRCVFSPLAGSPAEHRSRSYGIETIPISRFTLRELSRIKTVSAEVKADAVMTYGGPETFLARFLTRRGRVRLVRFRGQELNAASWGSAIKHKLAHGHIHTLITPSESMALSWRAIDPGRPAVCIPLGCDTEKFRYLRDLGRIATRPELLVLGRLDPVKGHEPLMRIFKLMLDKWGFDDPRPYLHIVGEPANLSVAHIEAYAHAAGLTLGVELKITATRVEGIAQLLNEAALGVVPSVGSEVICRVAEEFLLCGTPVVVSGVGSLDEVLAFSDFGASYRGKSETEAAALLGSWLRHSLRETDEDKRKRAARAAEEFSLAAMARQLEAILLT